MALDADWHKAHPMPRNATTAQRIAWHLEHAQRCSCRPIPARLVAEIAERDRASRARPGASSEKRAPARRRPTPSVR